MQLIARIFTGLAALALLVNVYYIINPDAFGLNGTELTAASARNDVRVMYGFLPSSIGLFLVPGVFRYSFERILLCAIIFSAASLGRVYGLIIDGSTDRFGSSAIMLEIPLALIAITLVIRHLLTHSSGVPSTGEAKV